MIDYVQTTPMLFSQARNLNIYEEGSLRTRGRKESDHNIVTYRSHLKNAERKLIWRTNNEYTWNNFDKAIENTHEDTKTDYCQFEKYLKNMMETNPGKITITPGAITKPNNPQIKTKDIKVSRKQEIWKSVQNEDRRDRKTKSLLQRPKKTKRGTDKIWKGKIEKMTDEISRKGGKTHKNSRK